MSVDDDDAFRPRPGRIRSLGDGDDGRHVNRILREVARLKPGGLAAPSRFVFTGTRIGRGAGVGHLAAWRAPQRDRYARRVAIKTHIAKLSRPGGGARLHLRYLQRGGVGADGDPGRLYDKAGDDADGDAFRKRCEGDRHQFRIIVSAEDATELDDPRAVIRELMSRIERDLQTRLDWVAADHFDTGHPHTHIVIRGKDQTGKKDLIIARDYIAHGMRERASDILTLELGPRSELEMEQTMRTEVGQDRFTGLDKGIVAGADEFGLLDARHIPRDAFARVRHAMRLQRLQRLERMGLARTSVPGFWQLSPDLEETLRRMGERGDIVKTMHRRLRDSGLERSASDLQIHDPNDAQATPLIGRVAAIGVEDELRDRRYLILDATDGRTHYVPVGTAIDEPEVTAGAIVEIAPPRREPREVDRTIARVAAANGGIYTTTAHALADPSSSEDYREAHVRRLEAMARHNLVARRHDGGWIVDDDYPGEAAAIETRRGRSARLSILSHLPLEAQVHAKGATWLDQQLVGKDRPSLRDAGFGREVTAALDRRRRWLIDQGLASEYNAGQGSETRYRRNLLATLRAHEVACVGAGLAEKLGKPFTMTESGNRIEGVYRRPVILASGKVALIERSHDFTLVPWRSVLERNLGKTVAGVLRGETVSWSLTRKRSLGIG